MNVPEEAQPQITIQTGRIKVTVTGVAARLIAYLASEPRFAADLASMENGELWITWPSPRGPFKAHIKKYYPSVKSSSIVGESS